MATRECSEIGHVALLGDFNVHAGVNGEPNDAAGRMLLNRAKELGLTVLNGDACVGAHTRVMERSDGAATATAIDYIVQVPHGARWRHGGGSRAAGI